MELIFDNVWSGYGRTEVLKGTSFTIDSPGITIVLGKNGSGKTTMFRTITGILKPMKGEIMMRNDSQGNQSPSIGYMAHSAGIPAGFTVEEALNFYAGIEGSGNDQVMEVKRLLNLTNLWSIRFNSLSQGQKKKVSLAKCLLSRKDIYIFDEPTSNLDPEIASEARKIMATLAEESIILYSSHNLYEAQEIGNRVLLLDNGKIKFDGNIRDIRKDKRDIGIRGEGIGKIFPNSVLKNEYYIFNVHGDDEVDSIIRKIVSGGGKIYEVKEMENILEGLYGIGQ